MSALHGTSEYNDMTIIQGDRMNLFNTKALGKILIINKIKTSSVTGKIGQRIAVSHSHWIHTLLSHGSSNSRVPKGIGMKNIT